MHPKSFKITSKSNSSLMSISRRGPVNPSTLTFPIINLTKPIKSLLLLRKSLKNGYNKLYFLLYTFDMNYKPFYCLTSLSLRGPLNPSIPTFSNNNLTEAMRNLTVAWKFS